MTTLRQRLARREYAITVELQPPKGSDVKRFISKGVESKGYAHAANVTDQQGSVMRMSSLAGCALLLRSGIEPILQVTCRDRNRIALQSDLLGAHALGIENILALTGDHTALGDHPQARPVFDLDAPLLLSAASCLERGTDLAGGDLQGAPTFFKGAACNLDPQDPELELFKMEKKISAGAQFFQSQAVFDAGRARSFLKRAGRLGVPILLGVVFLKSAGMARRLESIARGTRVPESMLRRLETAADVRRESLAIASETVRDLADLVQGLHFMAFGWEELIPEALQGAGLAPTARAESDEEVTSGD